MRVLIDSKIKFDGWSCIQEISQLDHLHNVNVSDLVIHHPLKVSLEDIILLSDWVRKFSVDVFYICAEPQPQLKFTVLGLGGYYLEDEFFLESSNTLNNSLELLKEGACKSTQKSLKENINILRTYLDTQGTFLSSLHKDTVVHSLNNLISGMSKIDTELQKQLQTSFKDYSKVVRENLKLRTAVGDLKETISKLKASVQQKGVIEGNLYYFPPVKYTGTKPIYRIKAVTHIPYLISFLMGFMNYLQRQNLRPQLVVVCPLGQTYNTRYKDFTWNEVSSDRVVMVDNPTSVLMKNLLDSESNNVMIICDLTVASLNHIVAGGKSCWYAVGSTGLAKKMGLPSNKVFSSINSIGGAFHISSSPNYPSNPKLRERVYESYEKDYNIMMGV